MQQQQSVWQLPPFQPLFLHAVPQADCVQELQALPAEPGQPAHVLSADSTPAIK